VARHRLGDVAGLGGAALGALLGLSLSGGGAPAMLVGLVLGYVAGEWLDGVSAGPGRRGARRGGRLIDVAVGLLALALGVSALLGYGRASRWLGLVGGVLLVLVGARLLVRRL
jgi:hypothetical protein